MGHAGPQQNTADLVNHRRAVEILDAILGATDWRAIKPDTVVISGQIPAKILDDAFALIGTFEDLEDMGPEANYVTVLGNDYGRSVGVGDDHETEDGW